MRVKKTKNGDPKKKKSKRVTSKNGFDKEPEKKKPTGGSGKNPTISAGAKADIKKSFMTEAEKAKEKDFSDSVRGKLEGVLYRAYNKESGDRYIDAKYKRRKEKKEPIRIGNITVHRKGDKRGRPTAQDETTSRQFERSKEKYEKELKAAKTPEEKQRVKDKYYSKKTQDHEKQAKEYKLGGKMKVKKYRNGGKNGDPKKKKDFSADVEARKKQKKSSGYDEDPRLSKKKPTGGSGKNPTISGKAKADIKDTFMTSAKKAKEKDRARVDYFPMPNLNPLETKDEYRKRQEKEKERGNRYAKDIDKVEAEIDAKYERERQRQKKEKETKIVQKKSQKDIDSDATEKGMQRLAKKKLDAAKTPKEKQRILDQTQSRKTQELDKQAKAYGYKSGGKIKVKKYKKGGKVKDKLKALAKKKYKNGGKNGDPEKKKSRSSDVVATKGEYKGSMVDPRTGMPKGTSKPPSKKEARNAGRIESLRVKMKEVDRVKPFSPESDKIRKKISKLRGR